MDGTIALCRLCDWALEAGGIYRLPIAEQGVFIELFRSGMLTERKVYDAR
jgi:hypothetical protein